MTGTETPFEISVSQTALDTLAVKLSHATLPNELEDVGWEYGVPLAHIQRLLAHWKDGFSWRDQEKALNADFEGAQFTRDIEVDGFGALNIHYIHKRSQVDGAIPLIFVHGWPGCFLEVRKVLPLLLAAPPSGSDKEYPSFHVVAISLPGFGFSDAPKKKGFSLSQHAEVAHKLMLSLGYNEYVTQGGDWGFFVTRKMALLYGDKHVKAWHTNCPVGATPHPIQRPYLFLHYLLTPLSAKEKAGIDRAQKFQKHGMGYLVQQTTQPQTLGYSLADSPIGLLAWIYEKLVNWSDGYPWSDDEVLTWISIYWFSKSGPTSSLQIYKEVFGSGDVSLKQTNPKDIPTIPLGISVFPKELLSLPMAYTGNTVFESEHDNGGHFAAYECPELLVGDLRNMFGKGGKVFGIVPGHSGYSA
ncbi:hypothetical protein ONZ45_g12393 [Pleurotus djamor]|nr:hypothetical protein ONZ45_g12393 [Pleurotus djamor]